MSHEPFRRRPRRTLQQKLEDARIYTPLRAVSGDTKERHVVHPLSPETRARDLASLARVQANRPARPPGMKR